MCAFLFYCDIDGTNGKCSLKSTVHSAESRLKHDVQSMVCSQESFKTHFYVTLSHCVLKDDWRKLINYS